MNNLEEQPIQQLQHCKIQLMQKQRRILSLESQLKKLQYKTARDLKQLKISEQKIRLQLKEESLKLDRMTKLYTDVISDLSAKEQIYMELIQDKDSQIQTIQSQYRILKQQMRVYLRIAPSVRFLNQHHLKYQQIQTYQQLYNKYNTLQQDHRGACLALEQQKVANEQKLRSNSAAYRNLQDRLMQIQKLYKAAIRRNSQLQADALLAKKAGDSYNSKYEEVFKQLQRCKQENGWLLEQLRKCKQINITYAVLSNQLRETNGQGQQCQIEVQKKQSQQKKDGEIGQIEYYEEQNMRLKERIQNDRIGFLQFYRNNNIEIKGMKTELDCEKKNWIKLKQQIQKCVSDFNTKNKYYVNRIKELEDRLSSLQKINNVNGDANNKINTHNIINSGDINVYGHQSEQQKQQKQANISISIQEEQPKQSAKTHQLKTQANEIKQDLVSRQGQIQMLQVEIQELKDKKQQELKDKNLLTGSFSYSYEPFSSGSLPKNKDIVEARRSRSRTQDFINLQKTNETNLNYMCSCLNAQHQQNYISAQHSHKNTGVHANPNQNINIDYADFNNGGNTISSKNSINSNSINLSKNNERSIQTQDKSQVKSQTVSLQSHPILKTQLLKATMSQQIQKQAQMHYQSKLSKMQASHKHQLQQLRNANAQLLAKIKYLQHQHQKQQTIYTKQLAVKDSQIRTFNKTIQAKSKEIQRLNAKIKGLQELVRRSQDLVREKQVERRRQVQAEMQNCSQKQIYKKSRVYQTEQTTIEQKIKQINSLHQYTDSLKQKLAQKSTEISSIKQQLRQQMQEQKQKYQTKIQNIQKQMKQYIHQIIQMKLKVANSEMMAAEKSFMLNQMKKKMNIL